MLLLEKLKELNPEAVIWEDMQAALLGWADVHNPTGSITVAVYDYCKMVKVLVERDSMDEAGAEEFIDYNYIGAYLGKNTPVIVCTSY